MTIRDLRPRGVFFRVTVQIPPFNRPFFLLFRRQTSFSPACGVCPSYSFKLRMRSLNFFRVRLVPTSTWSAPITSSVSSSSREIIRHAPPASWGSAPARISIDARMIGLSAAWRWISVSMKSGGASVKKPPPLTGGSWAGSPSTRTGFPKERRSRPSSSSTIEHSSMMIRSALEAGASRRMEKDNSPSIPGSSPVGR